MFVIRTDLEYFNKIVTLTSPTIHSTLIRNPSNQSCGSSQFNGLLTEFCVTSDLFNKLKKVLFYNQGEIN